MPANQELIDRRPTTDGFRRMLDVSELRQLARWMDSVFVIPGLNVRLGLDALLGLIPGIGDVLTSLVALYILQAASQRGVSRVTMARMGVNILIDWALGSVPILGDVFDVFWKANQRNVELLQRHAEANPETARRQRAGDWLFFALLATVLVGFLIGSLTITYFTVRWLGSMLFGAPH